MFFNRNYIPAVPIREEQRISEEEELARALKREARIFFPDKKLPELDEEAHDAICREEDSLRREADGSISRHELEAARQEAEQIARKQLTARRRLADALKRHLFEGGSPREENRNKIDK